MILIGARLAKSIVSEQKRTATVGTAVVLEIFGAAQSSSTTKAALHDAAADKNTAGQPPAKLPPCDDCTRANWTFDEATVSSGIAMHP